MNPKSILLVEDNSSDVALTRRAFEKNGIRNELRVASDGQDALDYLYCEGLHAGRDPGDMPILVLLDLKMPRIDGLEVLRRLRADARTRRIPVAILTSSTEEQDVAAGYDLGTNSYIRKPVDFQEFAEVVKQLGIYWVMVNEPPPAGTGHA